MEKTWLSPATVRRIGTVGSMVSFQEGSQLLRELAGIGMDASQVERGAEALGEEIAADERLQTGPSDDGPLPPTLYLCLDGTGVPMRAEELAGRAGKQSDGSAKTREVKICAVWSAEARQLPVRDEGSVSYSAAIESAATPDTTERRSAFAERVLREATRRRFCEAQRMVVVADGAPWVWNITQDLLPGAIQISSTPLSTRSSPMAQTAPTPRDADFISIAIATACAIHSSTNRALPPPASKPVAKSPSELV
jgi:hypothetical protein